MTDPLDALDAAARSRLRPNQTSPDGWYEPMLATLTDRRFSSPDWIFERKLDGVRAIVSSTDDGIRLWSRNHKTMNASYPELVDALRPEQDRMFAVDGEIVAFDGRQTSFEMLQKRIHLTDPARIAATGVRVYLYLFDILAYENVDLTRVGLLDRKKVLRGAFGFDDPVRFAAHRCTEGEEYFQLACERGWEGLIAKRAAAPYQHGRSGDWLKFKCAKGQEFVIGGFTDPSGARIGFGALLVGYYENGKLRYAGKVGTGYDERTLRSLRATLDELSQAGSPFDEPVHERGAHWVRPELVAQLGFTEWTRDGKLRHPRYLGLRQDKSPDEVLRERG